MADYMSFGWDDVLTGEPESEFVTLPEGDYPFTITNMERSEYSPSPNRKEPSRIPAGTKMIILTVKLDGGAAGSATVSDNLYLYGTTNSAGKLAPNWRLDSFFKAIGQRKSGEEFRPRWNDVIGSTGWCRVKVREWTGRSGEKMTSNDIARWLEPDPNRPVPADESGSMW